MKKYGTMALGFAMIVILIYVLFLRPGDNTKTASLADDTENSSKVISATGIVQPVRYAQLRFKTSGRIARLFVSAGDVMTEGQTLAEQYDTFHKGEVQGAQDALDFAKAQMAQVVAGPRPQEIAVAQSAYDSAQARLQKLKSTPNQDEINIARATLTKAAVAVQDAQTEYDKISYSSDVGSSPQARQLQIATLEYEAAKARYELATRGPTKEELAIAEGEIASARARLDLAKTGASKEELDVAKARVKQAETALAQAKTSLEELQLVAPFKGTVGQVLLREGELASPTDPVVNFGDLSELEVKITDLGEKYFSYISVGQKVELTFDSLPGRKFVGTVKKINPMASIETAGTNFTLFVTLDEQEAKLRWGMTANADFVIETR